MISVRVFERKHIAREISEFKPAKGLGQDFLFMLTMVARGKIDVWGVFEGSKLVGLAGFYDAPWGLTACLVTADPEEPRQYVRALEGLIEGYSRRVLYAHAREDTKGEKLLRVLGFEVDTYMLNEDDEIILRYRKGSGDGR